MLEFTEFHRRDHIGRPVVAQPRAKIPTAWRPSLSRREGRSFAELAKAPHPACPRAFYAQGVPAGREHVGFLLHRASNRWSVFFGISAALAVGGAGEPRATRAEYCAIWCRMPIWWAMVTFDPGGRQGEFLIDRADRGFPGPLPATHRGMKLTDAPRRRAIALVATGLRRGFVATRGVSAGASGVEADLIHALRARRVLVR